MKATIVIEPVEAGTLAEDREIVGYAVEAVEEALIVLINSGYNLTWTVDR